MKISKRQFCLCFEYERTICLQEDRVLRTLFCSQHYEMQQMPKTKRCHLMFSQNCDKETFPRLNCSMPRWHLLMRQKRTENSVWKRNIWIVSLCNQDEQFIGCFRESKTTFSSVLRMPVHSIEWVLCKFKSCSAKSCQSRVMSGKVVWDAVQWAWFTVWRKTGLSSLYCRNVTWMVEFV